MVLVTLVAGWRSNMPQHMHLLPLAVALVALVAGCRLKLPLQLHLLSLAVVLVAVAGWRQRLPLGTQLGIRTRACPGDLSCLCN